MAQLDVRPRLRVVTEGSSAVGRVAAFAVEAERAGRPEAPIDEAERLRSSVANALTVILLQAAAIRREAARGGLPGSVVETATEQIGLNVERVWRHLESTLGGK